LNVQVAASSQTTIVGGSVTFNIGVRNNGDGAASDVRVSSTALIAGEINRADYVSANAPGGCEIVLSGSTVKCNVGTLAPEPSGDSANRRQTERSGKYAFQFFRSRRRD
jgi:hypothetical protein